MGILSCLSSLISLSLSDFSSLHSTCWLGEHTSKVPQHKDWAAAKHLPNAVGVNTPET